MRVVVALGDDALLKRDQRLDVSARRHDVIALAGSLASLADRHELVITHGNGPQVGLLSAQSADDPPSGSVLGYWLLQALQNALPGRQVVAVVNQTLVSPADPAFEDPATFVGPGFTQDKAERLAAENGWTVRPDGDRWRRVVPSPWPERVIETELVGMLLRDQAVVVCAGGGGIPVIHNDAGGLVGVEAIVDRDLTASVLAEAVEADAFLILTEMPEAVQVEAAHGFIERTGGVATIGGFDQCVRLLEGTAAPTAKTELAS